MTSKVPAGKLRVPDPTEEGVIRLVTRTITIPSGETVKLSMGQWHWDMLALADQFNEYFDREKDYLWAYLKLYRHKDDNPLKLDIHKAVSSLVMYGIREEYFQIRGPIPDDQPVYIDAPSPPREMAEID